MTRLSSHHMYYLDSKIINVRLHTFFLWTTATTPTLLLLSSISNTESWKPSRLQIWVGHFIFLLKNQKEEYLSSLPYTVLSGKFLQRNKSRILFSQTLWSGKLFLFYPDDSRLFSHWILIPLPTFLSIGFNPSVTKKSFALGPSSHGMAM